MSQKWTYQFYISSKWQWITFKQQIRQWQNRTIVQRIKKNPEQEWRWNENIIKKKGATAQNFMCTFHVSMIKWFDEKQKKNYYDLATCCFCSIFFCLDNDFHFLWVNVLCKIKWGEKK